MNGDRRLRNLTPLLCYAAVLLAVAAAPTFAEDEKPLPQILFSKVHVINGTHDKRIENGNLLIEGNRIKRISTQKITAEGATVIDGGGRTLMPGIIDSHVHLSIAPDIQWIVNPALNQDYDQIWVFSLRARLQF